VPASPGWFVMNARGSRWFDKPGQGLPLSGSDEHEAQPARYRDGLLPGEE
jgi:hypothetical protein